MSELRTIARHAGTVLVGQLAVMSFGIADTLIAGRYSPQALAVLSLASSIYISIYVALNGLLQALLPVWAELHGAGRQAEVGRSVVSGQRSHLVDRPSTLQHCVHNN